MYESDLEFLEKNSLLENPIATRKLKRNASYYVIEGGDLYKKGFTAPLLKCLTRDQVKYVINKMHRGIYGMNLGSCSMTTRVLKVRYYLATMRND